MNHIIVATHGEFSRELVKTAEMIFGEAENTRVVTFLPGEGQDDLVAKYNAIIANFAPDDAVLFLVDMFGGSPYNAAVRVAVNRPQDEIITGVNLPILLEILDNIATVGMQELAHIAREVAGLSVKAYRATVQDERISDIQTPSETIAQAVDENVENYDPNGRMNVSLLRIDDRLIHGQVMTSWSKAVKCDAIFAVSDEVTKDDLRRELLLQIVPEHLKAYVISVEKAIKVYHNPKYASRNILILVTNPADVLRLIEGGVNVKSVNVGGMTYKAGNKMLSDAVAVGKRDVEAFQKLLDLGIDLSMQKVASNPKVQLDAKKLNEVKF